MREFLLCQTNVDSALAALNAILPLLKPYYLKPSFEGQPWVKLPDSIKGASWFNEECRLVKRELQWKHREFKRTSISILTLRL